MTDEELVKRLRDKHCCESPNCNCDEAAARIEALTEARDTMGHLWAKEAAEKQVALGRIEALTEQLEAARADAKEAEAYAEGLGKDQVDLCLQLIAAEDKLATCEKYRDAYAECDKIGTQAVRDLEAKLAKAVEELERQVEAWSNALELGILATQHRTSASILLDGVRATLAEIEGEKE